MIIQQRSGKENKEVGILSRNLRFLSAIFVMVFGALFGALPARAGGPKMAQVLAWYASMSAGGTQRQTDGDFYVYHDGGTDNTLSCPYDNYCSVYSMSFNDGSKDILDRSGGADGMLYNIYEDSSSLGNYDAIYDHIYDLYNDSTMAEDIMKSTFRAYGRYACPTGTRSLPMWRDGTGTETCECYYSDGCTNNNYLAPSSFTAEEMDQFVVTNNNELGRDGWLLPTSSYDFVHYGSLLPAAQNYTDIGTVTSNFQERFIANRDNFGDGDYIYLGGVWSASSRVELIKYGEFPLAELCNETEDDQYVSVNDGAGCGSGGDRLYVFAPNGLPYFYDLEALQNGSLQRREIFRTSNLDESVYDIDAGDFDDRLEVMCSTQWNGNEFEPYCEYIGYDSNGVILRLTQYDLTPIMDVLTVLRTQSNDLSQWENVYSSFSNALPLTLGFRSTSDAPSGGGDTPVTPATYKVTLDKQSGTGGTSEYYYQYNTKGKCYYYTTSALSTCTDSSDGQHITVPTRTGYTFGGYYTGKNGTGTQYVNASGLAINNLYKTVGNRTLYAKWTPKTWYVEFDDALSSATCGDFIGVATLEYNNQDYSGNQPDGCDWYGDDGYPHMPMPETRSGYTFAGWYTGVNGTGTQLTDENGRILDSVYTTDFGDDGATITAYAKWVSNGTPTFTVTVKTTDANTVFSFKLAAAGTFHVDWGDGSTVQTINRTNTTQTTYSHTFATAGTYTVGFAGRATAYVTQPTLSDSACTGNAGTSACNNSIPAFTLSGMGKYIYGMSGSIGSIFPTLASGAQPGFRSAFSSIQATSIPENLFSGITGTPTTCMFTGTFYGAKITSIPENLFHGITGTAPASFAGTFWATKITSIPAGLFSTITGTVQPYMFEATFTDTTALTSIPAGLFGGVTGAPARCAFKDAFRSTGAKSLPANLFPNLSGKPGYYSLKNMFALANTLSGYVPASMFTNLDSTDYSAGPMDSIFVRTALATSCPAGKYQYLTGFERDWSGKVACSACPKTPYTDSGTDTETITNGTRSRTKTRSCYKTSVGGNTGGIAACDATTACNAYTYGAWTYTCNTGYHLSGTTCVANTYTIKYYANGDDTVTGTTADTTCTYDQDCKLATNGFTYGTRKFVGWSRLVTQGDSQYANGATVKNLTGANGGTVNLYGRWSQCTACNATNANCTLTAPLGVCTYATSCKTGYGNIQNNGKYNASCSANTYTITLRDYADANTHSTIYQVYGSKYYSDTSTKAAITKAAVPSRSGYKFRGFYTAKQSDLTANGGSGTRRITSDGTLPGNTTFTANTKLYAAWAKDCTTPANGTCSLTINANGTATYTASCNSGYTVSGATTATPSCTANTYTVTYAANGGTGSSQTQSVTYKSSFTTKASNTFTRNGYTFAGWGGSYPKSNTAYTYTTTGNTTLNAQWCQNCASVSNGSCKLTVNEATGACTYATSCNAGYTISNNGKYNPTCTANTYTVTYAANGGTGSNQTQSVTYKSSFTTKASNTFTRSGYTFAGWGGSYPKSNTAYTYTTTGNTTLNAQWCHNCASVSNGSCKLTVNEATGACTYTTSCNAGYTISNNGKYNPTCTANTYTVSFNVNGGTGGQSASVTATYGAAMPAISTTAPTKTGYTFGGWYDTSAATGGTQYYTAAGASARSWNKTANTTLYARWTVKSITCAAGKYLPANKDACATCVAGYSCAGGTWTYDGSEHGRTQCTGATYAGAGASTCTSCPSPYTYDKSAGKTKVEQCTVQTSAGYYIKTANGGEENCPYGYYCPSTVVAYGSTGGATACPDGVQNKPSKWPDNYHDVTRVSMDDSFSMGNSRKTIDECVFAYDLENSRGTIFAVHSYNSQTGKYDIQVQDGFWMWYKSLKSGYYLGKKWTYNGQDGCQVNGNGESKLYQDALPCPTDAYCPGYDGTIESSGWPKCGDGVYAAETGYCPAIASHTVDTWSAMYRNPTIVETKFFLDGGAADGSTFLDTGGETGPCMAEYLLQNDAGTILTMQPYSVQTGKYKFYSDDAETLNLYKDYYTFYISLNPGYYFTKRWSRTLKDETITMCDHAEAGFPRFYVEAEPCPAGSYCPGIPDSLADSISGLDEGNIPDSWPKCGDTAPYTDIYNKYACPTTYPNSAAKSSAIEQCYLTTTAGKYVATARADQVQCLANNYCTGGTQVNYGSTGGMQSCATGYESTAGASSCTATTYSITYNLNGGTNASSNPAKYTVETATITLAAPTKTGYTFGGWYTNSGLTGNAVTKIAKGSTGNKIFWAKWTVKSVTCAAGKYLPANSLTCGDCTAGYACPGGTYSYSSSIQGRTQCTGATYSGAGAATCATCPSIYTSDTTAGKTKITDCKVKTTAGKYIANANDSAQTACTTGHYCPSETVAYGSTNTPTACPTADATTARTTYPTDYLNPTMLTIKNQTWSTGWAKKSQCSANYTFTNVAGNFTVESVQFNETTGKYDNGGGKYYTKVNGGYYLVDQYSSTYCNVASHRMLYHNVAECPAGSYCPGYASMPLCSSGTYETTMGLYTCPTTYPNSAAKSSAETQCYLTTTAGKYVATAKADQVACTAGYKCPGNITVYYGSTGGRTQCTGATYAGAGASACTACPSGYTTNTDNGKTAATQCTISVAAGKYLGTKNETTVSTCAAGTYKAAHTVNYGSTSSCSACTGRTKYSAAGAASCSNVSTGYYTTGCNTSGNNCTGQSQCNGSVYCTSGILNNCPTAESGWTAGTGKGWSAVTSCFETKAATSVSTYCSAGQLKKNATNGTTWGASTISTALTAKPGAIVNGQTCTQCIGSTYSAGGTATLCELCPDGYTNDISNGKTAASQCAISVNGGHYIGTAGQNSTNWGTCAAGTYKGAHTVYYGSTSSCSACTGRTKYSAAGASACSTVSSGYYTTGCTGDDKCTGQTQCTSGTWCASGVMKQCSSLSGVSVSGGTYSSAVGSTANTACKYTGPSKTLSGCKTVTTNTVTYSGTAWPTTTYSVTANGGYIISNNNQAAAACTQCNGAVYSAGGTATSCAACPSAESGWTAGTGKGWSAVTSCFETKAATSVSTYCSAGQLKKNATNGTTWGASTISVPLQAKAGSIVSGQTCEQCSGAKYSAGGTVTNCASCPTADTGWTLGTGTGWTSYSACYEYQTPANCASGSVKRTATSATAYSTTIALLNKLSSKAGYYASATATSCTICPKGSSCVAGAVNPTACANWSYADKTGMSSCTSCPTVTSGWDKSNTTGTGWTSYTQCQQTTGAPEHCVSGGLKQTATSSTAWGASTVNAALSAQAGYYVNGIACSICIGATYSGGGTLTKCDECPTIYTHNTTDGKIRIDQCQAKTTAGKYIKTENDDMETVCAAGGYCAGGTIVNWGGIGGRTLCTAGTYNPNTGSSLATACVKSDAGYYVDTNGATAQTACTGATYTDAAGATKCTTCPTATKYADALARYSYYNTGAIGDHTTKTKCQAIFNSRIDHGTLVNDACYLGSDNDYGTSTSNGASTCWLLKDGLSCDGGYYNKSQSASTRATVLSNACIAVGAGYWSATGGLTRTQCGSGLTTIGYGAGADEAGDCGRILHAGNHTIYLRNTKKTTPSLNVDINGTVFYGNMTRGTTYGKFRVNNGGTVYSVHNDAVESITRPIAQGQVSMSGPFTNTTKRLRTDYIPVEPNTQYTVTYTSTATPNLIYATYDANKSMLSRANSKRTGFTFTTEANAKYVAFTWYGNDSATVTPSDVQNFRLEQW